MIIEINPDPCLSEVRHGLVSAMVLVLIITDLATLLWAYYLLILTYHPTHRQPRKSNNSLRVKINYLKGGDKNESLP